MKFIIHEDVPRWYHLFWNKECGELFLRIHRFFLEHCPYQNLEPYFANIETHLDYLPLFDSYEPRIGQQRFGVNESIVLAEEDADWMAYRIAMPKVVRQTGLSCVHCGGTGKRDVAWEDECGYCNGEKLETDYFYKEIQEVCYSLQILLSVLQFPIDEDIPTDKKQLFEITTCCMQGSQGHSMGGYISPEFVRFFEKLSDSYDNNVLLPCAQDAMYQAHVLIYGEVKAYDKHSFRAYTRGGQFNLSCPGNACELHTDCNRRVGDGYGADLTCHNLDSSIQQLTLLAGLGSLSTWYDELH